MTLPVRRIAAVYAVVLGAIAFLLLFGELYLGDGLLGLATGSGFLDLGILLHGIQPMPFGFKLLANGPHLLLGGIAVLAGWRAGTGRRP